MNSDAKALTPALEDYLEAVAKIVARKGEAHAKDIAKAVSVHISTVTTALRNLSEKGLINYRPYKAATLTKEGEKLANRIIWRHNTISRFLSEILLVEKNAAEENACRMEHVLDQQVIDHLLLFASFVKECPRAGNDWLGRFQYFLEHDGNPPPNENAMEKWLQKFKTKIAYAGKDEESHDITSLDQLKNGEKAWIVKIQGTGPLRRRLVDIGTVEGATIEAVEVKADGPIKVRIGEETLNLGKDEASKITVQKRQK